MSSSRIPVAIFCQYHNTAFVLAGRTGFHLGEATNQEETHRALREGKDCVLMARCYATGWRAVCIPMVLDEVTDPATRQQCHHRGSGQ